MIQFLRKVRVALTPRSWLLKSRLKNGALVFGINRPGFGGRGIYIFRDSIEPEFTHLEEFLDPAAVFVDIGANTGIYSLKAAKFLEAGGGVVIAIEPFPNLLSVLYRSVQANNFSNVRLRNFCAASTTGSATFWQNFNKPHSSGLIKRDDQADSLPVLAVAFDDLFDWENLDRLDYIKIDVEGSEQDVLTGAKNAIEKHRPIIQFEITIEDFRLELDSYSVFQAAGSPNKVCIPNEHTAIDVPDRLNWEKIA